MTTDKGEKTRARIFDAAARLFAQKGYAGASMRDLADELGLQKSSLYHHFDSKEDLLHQLVDEFMDQALERIEALLAQPLPPLDKLSAFIRFYTSVYAGDRDRLTVLVNELDSLGPRRRRAVVAKQRRYVAAIQGILEETKQAGVLRDIPTPVAVFAFFGMVHFTPQWYDPQGKVTPQELGRLFEEVFCHGVLTGPGTPPQGPRRRRDSSGGS